MWIGHRKEIQKLTFRALALRWSELTIIPWARVGYEMVNTVANEARRVELAVTNLVSIKREWNNCFIKFSTFRFAKFYSNDLKVLWLPGAKTKWSHDHIAFISIYGQT